MNHEPCCLRRRVEEVEIFLEIFPSVDHHHLVLPVPQVVFHERVQLPESAFSFPVGSVLGISPGSPTESETEFPIFEFA